LIEKSVGMNGFGAGKYNSVFLGIGSAFDFLKISTKNKLKQ